MGVWDEKIPGVGGSDPTNPGMSNFWQTLSQLASMKPPQAGGPASGGGGGAGMTPPVVGGAPPTMTPPPPMSGAATGSAAMSSGSPGLPGMATLTQSQAGGPAARHPAFQGLPVQDTYQSKSSRNAALVSNSVAGLGNAVIQYKQQKFQKESAQAAQVASMKIAADMAKAKPPDQQSEGDKMLIQQADKMMADPKIAKILEKAQTDPMSGAYVGIQQAHQQRQAQIAQEADIEHKRAQADAERALAEQRRGEAEWYKARPAIEQNKIDAKVDADTARYGAQKTKQIQDSINKARATGLAPVTEPDGSTKLNKDGTIATRNLPLSEMTDEERIKMNAMNQLANQRARLAESTTIKARVSQLREQRMAKQSQIAADPGAIRQWADLVTNMNSGVSLANVPAPARSAVVAMVAASGRTVVKPITNDEIKRVDLASNAQESIEHAQEILRRRPDMFGPGGFLKTGFKKALVGGDQDAIDFQADIEIANLPTVGVHGVRGKWALEDLKKYDGNLYINQESMAAVLDNIHRSLDQLKQTGGRRGAAAGEGFTPSGAGGQTITPPPPASGASADNPLGLKLPGS